MRCLLAEMQNRIGTITFDHDRKRNALSHALIDAFIATLRGLKAERARAVVLRAHAGAKVWSAGHDLTELPQPGQDPLPYDDPLERMIRAVEHFPAPII